MQCISIYEWYELFWCKMNKYVKYNGIVAVVGHIENQQGVSEPQLSTFFL